MVSALDTERTVRVQAMAGALHCVLGQDTLLSTLRWTSIPSKRRVKIILVTSYYGNWDKLRPDGPLGSFADYKEK